MRYTLTISGDSENDKKFIEAVKDQEFPSFKKTEQERNVLGEFFNFTTPVQPNYLKYLVLDGNGDILLLFIEKLKYTLIAVTDEVYIANFTIDESTFCKLIEA
eukprot:CAMPEP_0168319894 /NCGR_PEP_ID=MMETSP0213-20121227/1324_1 /TAXON_ID=151035 /ORGANISM="Euplotes harpa, Strain FSP1.4" /LENGTH=102 /DNA_ID=CAMNT_0008321195 /DNA_START=64 /DNA_END=372 /DNA_ORIENTATION=-